MSRTRNNIGFSMFILKIIAVLSMLSSHISIVFEKQIPENLLLPLFYFGRLAFPIFAFSIANGWKRTHNRLFYALRILAMAIVSQIPFAIVLKGVVFTDIYHTFFSANLNIGFSFLLALACLLLYDLLRKMEFPKLIALACALLPAIAFEFLTPFHVDYGYMGTALILVMYATMNDRTVQVLSVSAVLAGMSSIIKIPTVTVRADVWLCYFASVLLIMLYNGHQGAKAKYLFYIFYPLHIIILYLLKVYVI